MPTPTISTAAAGTLPAWHPAWARELAELCFSGTTSLFIVHGNVNDLVRAGEGDGLDYCGVPEFLATQVFGSYDLVLGYDLSRGLRPQAGRNDKRHRLMQQYLLDRWGEPGKWPRDPDAALALLDALIVRNLLEEPANRKSMAMLFEYGQYLVPAGDLGTVARGQASCLVRLIRWAQRPFIEQAKIAFCLIADRLAELNDRLVESPYVDTIEIPLPDRDERCRFTQWATRGQEKGDGSNLCAAPSGPLSGKLDLSPFSDFTPDQLADLSNGMSLVSLNVVLTEAIRAQRRIDQATFRQLKKSMIERQCRGLVEFVEPDHNLDMVAGMSEAKKRLREDAALISRGQLDAAPMGYLICGAVGTGKTFLAECYAGSIGIPCVVLKNFRSKYVGETEGNLQQVLSVLRSLGPVVVIVDEADAALGSRQAEGDSGTSARVFSMIAQQMGNTRYRGRIIWMLLTSRPDLLPIDLKRQGRAEVHIPLFYPWDEAEIREMFAAMAKKNKVKLADSPLPLGEGQGVRASGSPLPTAGEGQGVRAVLGRGLPTTPPPPTEGLPETSGDLRSAVPAGSGDPRRTVDSGDPRRTVSLSTPGRLSGADIESIVLAAKRVAMTAGRAEVTAADLDAALKDFIPSAQGLEKELQEIAAVLECTQMGFLPPAWREKVLEPDGRTRLQERLANIRKMLDTRA